MNYGVTAATTSLQHREWANASAASYWWRRVLDVGGRQEYLSSFKSFMQAMPGAESAMHHCLIN